MEKKLTKGAQKSICGVCSGLAEYLNLDATLIRVIYAALTLFTAGFPGVLLYIVMAVIMPEKNQGEQL